MLTKKENRTTLNQPTQLKRKSKEKNEKEKEKDEANEIWQYDCVKREKQSKL